MSEKDQKSQPVTPTIPEITGLKTAVEQAQKALEHYEKSVQEAVTVEARVMKFREDLNKRIANDPMIKLFATPEAIAKQESDIADGSRKAVKSSHDSLLMHVKTMADLSTQLNAKYGKTVQVTKSATANNPGTITDGNRDELRTVLESRGYTNLSFVEVAPGHYQVTGTSSTGKIRTGKYHKQVIDQWA